MSAHLNLNNQIFQQSFVYQVIVLMIHDEQHLILLASYIPFALRLILCEESDGFDYSSAPLSTIVRKSFIFWRLVSTNYSYFLRSSRMISTMESNISLILFPVLADTSSYFSFSSFARLYAASLLTFLDINISTSSNSGRFCSQQ